MLDQSLNRYLDEFMKQKPYNYANPSQREEIIFKNILIQIKKVENFE